jgi:hypothetical protein
VILFITIVRLSTMMRQGARVAGLILLGSCCGWADVTWRYMTTLKFAPWFPQQIAAETQKQIAAQGMGETITRIKGNRASFTLGVVVVITDFGRDEITLINTKDRQYATESLSKYPNYPEVAAAGESYLRNSLRQQ